MRSLIVFFLCSTVVFSWGKNGHRVVAEYAQQLLTEKTKKQVLELLDGRDLWMVANWADDIRNLPEWKKADFWHWVTFRGREYHEAEEASMLEHILMKIPQFHQRLKEEASMSAEKRVEALKWLVHLIGDIHQPLHTGGRDDQGGNQFEVQFFEKETNLHVVWDELLVEYQELSFRDMIDFLGEPGEAERLKGNSLDPITWAEENQPLLEKVYSVGEERRIQWGYCYRVRPILFRRLRLAGMRLASVLEDIFGESQ